MASELDRKVRKAVISVHRRKVLDRIIKLFHHQKADFMEERSDHTRFKGTLSLGIGGGTTTFHVESYGQFHQNMLFQVRYGGALMLEARSGMRDEVTGGVDPRLVVGNDSHAIAVLTFRPGLWMKLLNLKWLDRQKEKLRRERERAFAAEKARREASEPPPRLDDFTLKQRFAL